MPGWKMAVAASLLLTATSAAPARDNFLKDLAGAMLGGGAVPNSAQVPDTPECREYERFARTMAGPIGTLSPLTEKYTACLNSAPNSDPAKKYRCAPGTYVSYVNGIRRCVKR